MTEQEDRYRAFWEALIAEIKDVRPELSLQSKPSKKAGIRLDKSPRTSGTYRLWWSGRPNAKQLRTEFFILNDQDLYRELEKCRPDVEHAFGGQLDWEPIERKKSSRIVVYHAATYRLQELPNAQVLCPWILETLDRLQGAINPILLGHTSPRSLSGDEAGAQVLEGQTMPEGATTHAEVLRYERSDSARAACLQHFGYRCQVCNLDFEERYGELGRGFMHVHHIVPLHEVAGIANYRVNPINDLRPVCPNCHAMLHRRKDRTLTVEELRELLPPERRNDG